MKVRASSLGKIMATDAKDKITDKQLLTLNGLLEKVKLTEAQCVTRDKLIAKRDAPPALSTGAKTFIRTMALEDKHPELKRNIESKYLDKGILVEDKSIDLACKVFNWGDLLKNELYFENDYICGTPDVITDDFIVDVKTPFDIHTFFKHHFETRIVDSNYYWQLMGYMMLTGRTTAYLCYCLVNTPEHIFYKELESTKWKVRDNLGVLDLPADKEDEIFQEVYDKHHFDFMDDSKRVKMFKIESSEREFNLIKQKVELAREYYNEVFEKL
jgi:hypothetical protein